MTRTQLQIDDETYEALRARAFSQHRSMSSVARQLLRESLGLARPEPEPVDPEFTFIGSAASGHTDISERHDDYLAEDFL